MCQRAFGRNVQLDAIQELTGGTFNETYRLTLVNAHSSTVVLRVAPPPDDVTYWDDIALMRREHHIQPYFAALASLMPQTLMADFTHQLLNRDYIFQTFLQGERWEDVEDELTQEQSCALWHQCGEIVKQMHTTTGTRFGFPLSGSQFSSCQFLSWSETVLDRFERITASMIDHQFDPMVFTTIAAIAKANSAVLDEINTPCLLHGDLWTFNLLIQRDSDPPQIVGVIDADRAWWGDPMADWIIFLLTIRQSVPKWQPIIQAFYEGYGEPEPNERDVQSAQFRQQIYTAMHIGSSVIWSIRQGHEGGIERGHRELGEILTELSK
ncbi:MAG: aminoglycoside phosphotransferase family protein [Chloroflexota bacterium]